MSQDADLKTVGETLIGLLEINGVDVVFGIPGVHTVELYRGLASSKIRHVTPRHEQGAGFMADGYARITGKPGVCFVITGPGLTNVITAMAQAREDSIPMLVISGVNSRRTLGQGLGKLHELPDQRALMQSFALDSYTLLEGAELPGAIDRAFSRMLSGRPGPVHIEIPTDVMKQRLSSTEPRPAILSTPRADAASINAAAAACEASKRPVLLVGGGAVRAETVLRELAERLDAPVVLTTNARGLMAGHPLAVPASPSLASVRALLGEADLVIALGSQLGPTDCDIYEDGQFPALARLIRVEIDAGQIVRGPRADVAMLASVDSAAQDLLKVLPERGSGRDGAERARATREAAWEALPPKLKAEVEILHCIRDAVPHAVIVGDSTQLVYAGNVYCDMRRPLSWFNSATGYGALGYAPPAAIGAAIGEPGRTVVCVVGDGGIQFSLAEIGSAVDEKVSVIFLVWNNGGYQEIENFMIDAGIAPEGVRPTPPDFGLLARSYGLDFHRVDDPRTLSQALGAAVQTKSPALIEIREADWMCGVKRTD